MLREFKNRYISFLVLPFLMYGLLGQAIPSSVVLCIGENDHVALESTGNCPQGFIKNSREADETNASSNLSGKSFQKMGGSCFDIPVLTGSSEPHLSSVQYLQTIRNMINLASSYLSGTFSFVPVQDRFSPKNFSLPSFSLPILQSTVLLI